MKIIIPAILTCCLLSLLYAEEEPSTFPKVTIGDSVEQVVERLGPPDGYMETGKIAIYYFDLGSVHMKDGKVTSMNLISPETLEKRQKAEAKAREKNRIKGEKLLASIKKDDLFSALPAEDRLMFWEKFRQDYPEVDVYTLYTTAKIEALKVERDRQEEERIASLERRVRNAEIEADRARRAAETQQAFNYTRFYNRSPSVVYYPQSYVIRSRVKHHTPSRRISGSYSNGGVKLNVDLNSGIRKTSNTSSQYQYVVGPQGTLETGTYLNTRTQ